MVFRRPFVEFVVPPVDENLAIFLILWILRIPRRPDSDSCGDRTHSICFIDITLCIRRGGD